MELDRPLTSDETRRLAESWKKRYSVDTTAERSSSHENINDVKDPSDTNDANDANLQTHDESNSNRKQFIMTLQLMTV